MQGVECIVEKQNKTWENPVSEVDRETDIYRTL